MTYKIVRGFLHTGRKVTIDTGLTLAAAQAHCKDPETSSSTCMTSEGRRRTSRHGPWFDGYKAE